MLVKVVAAQARLGNPLTLEEKIHIFKQRPDFVCLPEYFTISESCPDHQRAALKTHDDVAALSRLSLDLGTCLIGGSVVEPSGKGLYNTSFVFNRGNLLNGYRKRQPVSREGQKGILAGDRSLVVDIEGIRIGLLICGDVFYPELFVDLGRSQADIIFIPTTSPFRPDDDPISKDARDQSYFVDGATLAGAYVVKTCGVGSLFGKALQGRSLIAAPWGIVRRVDPSMEQHRLLLIETLDIEEIREFRRKRMLRLGKVGSTEGSG